MAAVDLLTNAEDGLTAHLHYQQGFTLIQSDFDHLPLEGNQFNLAVFNAAFHYSVDYERTLREVCRVLGSEGQVIIVDSPLYRQRRSGEQMVREREAGFRDKYGFPSNSIQSENFLTTGRLQEFSRTTDLRWQLHHPFYGLGWALRPGRLACWGGPPGSRPPLPSFSDPGVLLDCRMASKPAVDIMPGRCHSWNLRTKD